MAKFNQLDPMEHYMIIDGETGHSRGDGIQGSDVMAQNWKPNDEAWLAGEEEFKGKPIEIAS